MPILSVNIYAKSEKHIQSYFNVKNVHAFIGIGPRHCMIYDKILFRSPLCECFEIKELLENRRHKTSVVKYRSVVVLT